MLVAPTVFGNVLLGPTAEDLDDKAATGSTAAGLEPSCASGAPASCRRCSTEEVTDVYAGLRAATEHARLPARAHPEQGYVCVGGIRSTGLTASLAIAEHVAGLLTEARAGDRRAREPAPSRRACRNSARRPRGPTSAPDLVAPDPEYGRIVCHCERVTLGEIRDALVAGPAADRCEGLRRRTRARMGRCQGFYCGAAVRALACEASRRDAPR